ncbi:MAG TPA: PadR family transcriptional regulator [Candidatus Dormibacteraeota bacterium]|nr:PadR family transcriptional regulator [Candidatus Dormibacteraeota bacterium]
MSLQGCLAALLLDGSAHGYQLKATLEAELGPLWATRASQVYLTLGRMVRDGLVTSRRVQQTARPDRQLLSLTSKGRQAAERWLFDSREPGELVVRLAVGRLVIPERFAELVVDSVEERASALRGLRELRASVDGGFQPEAVDAEIQRVKAELRWVSSLRERAGHIARRPRSRARVNAVSSHAG